VNKLIVDYEDDVSLAKRNSIGVSGLTNYLSSKLNDPGRSDKQRVFAVTQFLTLFLSP
jgi:hypothetical protein